MKQIYKYIPLLSLLTYRPTMQAGEPASSMLQQLKENIKTVGPLRILENLIATRQLNRRQLEEAIQASRQTYQEEQQRAVTPPPAPALPAPIPVEPPARIPTPTAEALGITEEHPLHRAAYEGQLEDMRRIVQERIDQFTRETTELLRAAYGPDEDIHAQVSQAVNQNIRDMLNQKVRGLTPLHIAALRGHNPIIHYLLSKYPEIQEALNLADDEGNTPLHLAMREGQRDAGHLLLAAGANFNIPNAAGQTPFDLSAPNPTVRELLIQYQDFARRETTPLLEAAAQNNIAEAGFLIEHFAELNPRGPNRNTPLHIAASLGSNELARLLLEGRRKDGEVIKASINERNAAGDTPLHIAARNKNQGLVQLLLAQGAAQYIENNQGETPIDLAPEYSEVFRAVLPREGFAESARLVDLHRTRATDPTLPREEQRSVFAGTGDEIVIVPSLQQSTEGANVGDFCGYYSLWNAYWFSRNQVNNPARLNREAFCTRQEAQPRSFLTASLEDILASRGQSAVNPQRLTAEMAAITGGREGDIVWGGFGNLERTNIIRLLKRRNIQDTIAIDTADIVGYAIANAPGTLEQFVQAQQATMINEFIDGAQQQLVIILGTGLKTGHWITIFAERQRDNNKIRFTVADSIYLGEEHLKRQIEPLIYALNGRWEMLRTRAFIERVFNRTPEEILPELFGDVAAARITYPNIAF